MSDDYNVRWVGWYFRAGTWHRACQAVDMRTCARLLVEVIDREHVRDACSCMTTGNVPTFVPSHAQQHRVAQDASEARQEGEGSLAAAKACQRAAEALERGRL